MPFIPHTEDEIREMLEAVGATGVEELFEDIPLNLIGPGAYEHHIPAPVRELTTRGEFYTAYTPYQAEASQGTLQVIYEFQSMIAALTGMDVANASMYDGASALAEACLMAVRANRKSSSRRILVAGTVHPAYRRVTRTIAGGQRVELVSLPYSAATGSTELAALQAHAGTDLTAVVIQQPNFFGALEEVDELTDWAHANGALVIAVVNPTSLALLEPPGQWGERGADIACGEGHPLGCPLSSGGPYFGFMSCRQAHVRQMPGRIVGGTVDLDGEAGFVLTLQAREQHIRRSKATSNICTNQGLLVTAATIYMSLLGFEGLRRVASVCQVNTAELVRQLTEIRGVSRAFTGPHFHEAVVQLDRPTTPVLEQLAARDIIGGLDLGGWYPELGPALLVCATETRTPADTDTYVTALREIMLEAHAA